MLLLHGNRQLELLGTCTGIGFSEALEVDPHYLNRGDPEVLPYADGAVELWANDQRAYRKDLEALRSPLGAECNAAVARRDLRARRMRTKPASRHQMEDDDLAILKALSPADAQSWKQVFASTDYSYDHVRRRGSQLREWGFAKKRGRDHILSEEGQRFLAED